MLKLNGEIDQNGGQSRRAEIENTEIRTEPNRDKRFKNMKEEVERQKTRLEDSKIGLMGATREVGA